MNYRVFMAFHVISIISWMAGILYLYRILVYSAEQGRRDESVTKLLETMGARLYKYITVPAMSLSWVFGIAMIWLNLEILSQGWFHVKLAAVIIMSALTGYAGKLVARYRQGTFDLTSKRVRILNEIPTLLMIIIVFMVILKP
jgi:putative membrane protein